MIQYRPEIDVLRSLAVISVIAYHLSYIVTDITFLPGGLLGVDIFFVISGYLITKILKKEFKDRNKNKVKISHILKFFYLRRAKRILPALFLVTLSTSLLAYLILLPDKLVIFFKSLISSLIFTSNHFFHINQTEYGNINSMLNPLLHTWSLSIEEQFYLLFPIFLFFILLTNKKKINSILILLIIISLFINIYLNKHAPVINFYFLGSRAFELLAGCYLAFDKKAIIKKKNVFVYLGLVLILISLNFFNYKTSSYSHLFFSVITTLGSFLIIKYYDKPKLLLFLFENKCLIYIGKISYSLYLWHFPLISFYLIIGYQINSITLIIFYLFIVFLLSSFSYHFFEQPIRKFNKISIRSFFLINFLIIIIVFTFSLKIIFEDGKPERFSKFLLSYDYKKPSYNNFSVNKKSCFARNSDFCKINYNKNNKNVVLIGDSHASVLQKGLNKLSKEYNYNFISATYHYMYLADATLVTDYNKQPIKDYEIYQKNIKNMLDQLPPSIIIFHARYPLYVNKSYFDNKEGGNEGGLNIYGKTYINNKTKEVVNPVDSIINMLSDLAKKHTIILIYSVPEVGWHVPQFLIKKYKYNLDANLENEIKEKSNWLTTRYDVFIERNKFLYDKFDKILNQNIIKIKPHELLCNKKIKQKCLTHNENEIFYYDYDHLSFVGSKIILKEIEKKLFTIN